MVLVGALLDVVAVAVHAWDAAKKRLHLGDVAGEDDLREVVVIELADRSILLIILLLLLLLLLVTVLRSLGLRGLGEQPGVVATSRRRARFLRGGERDWPGRVQ